MFRNVWPYVLYISPMNVIYLKPPDFISPPPSLSRVCSGRERLREDLTRPPGGEISGGKSFERSPVYDQTSQ